MRLGYATALPYLAKELRVPTTLKIETGPQRLIWIWTHALVDWLRLFAWHWLP